MTDITAAVAAALGKIVDGGHIEAAIEKALQATITRAIEEQLGCYGEFGRALQEKVKAALAVDLSDCGIGGYNAIVLDIIRRKLGPTLAELGAQRLEEDLGKLLSPAPAEKKLSELVEDFKEWLRGEYVPRKEQGNRIAVHVDRPSDHEWGHWRVCLDHRLDRPSYDCAFSFSVSVRDGRVYFMRYAPRLGYSGPRVFIGGYYGFERTLFQLHACKTKLVMDPDAVDPSMTWKECHCD
jgi:hypothetical protein